MPRSEPQPIKVEWDDGLICHLPLTTPKGKVRVKRGNEPLATRSVPLAEGDLLEWQISYKGFVELAQLLRLGYENKLIGRQELEELEEELRSQRKFFSDQYEIHKVTTKQVFEGFEVIYRRHPILRKDLENNISIEVELKLQQRGTQAQPMVFLLIPIENLLEYEDLLGRKARPNEVARWRPPPGVLFEVVRAFAVASPQHRDDMREIIKTILR